MPKKEEILKLNNLNVEFPLFGGILQREVSHVHAVKNVSFSVKKGEKSNFSLTLTYSDSTWDEVEIVSSNTAPHQSFEYISTTIERNEIQNNQEIIQLQYGEMGHLLEISYL